MKVYLIPGLGYDGRIFGNLDFASYNVELLDWIEPEEKEEIGGYARRMGKSLLNDKEKVLIVGHSLGGIIAQEIAAYRQIEKIILISSIKSRAELPLQFKIVAPLGLHRFFTKALCIRTVRYWGRAHGFDNDHLVDLFKSMVGRHSNEYLQWALKSLSKWSGPKATNNIPVFQIHGTDDKTLPFKNIRKPDLTIKKGSHILAYKRHNEINESILREIENCYQSSI